ENSLSAFGRRHKFVFSLVYNTSYKNKDNKAARALLNGWTIAPIFNWFSGQRYTGNVSGSAAAASFGLTGSTPGGGVNGSGGATRFALFPRNFFHQPSIQFLDLRLSRRFSIGEKAKIEVLAEAFNFFNRTQVTTVSTTLYSICSTGTTAAPCSTLTFNGGANGFGSVTGADSTLFRERQVQLAVR